jgi:NADH-ubiquinone oxidoreductase chain 6
MNNLFTIYETYTNGYRTEVLDIISLLAILCGIFVIISKNPIVSVLFLIGLFANISCYLILIGLSFIGLSYLIVYIGAVSILFLFILMLINIRISELQSNTSNSIPLAAAIAVSFNYPVFQLLPYNIAILNSYGAGGRELAPSSGGLTGLPEIAPKISTLNNILYNISSPRTEGGVAHSASSSSSSHNLHNVELGGGLTGGASSADITSNNDILFVTSKI